MTTSSLGLMMSPTRLMTITMVAILPSPTTTAPSPNPDFLDSCVQEFDQSILQCVYVLPLSLTCLHRPERLATSVLSFRGEFRVLDFI